eukprot:scaffold5752_cov120-Cylindrotheca_fusiformis.AAC.2
MSDDLATWLGAREDWFAHSSNDPKLLLNANYASATSQLCKQGLPRHYIKTERDPHGKCFKLSLVKKMSFVAVAQGRALNIRSRLKS